MQATAGQLGDVVMWGTCLLLKTGSVCLAGILTMAMSSWLVGGGCPQLARDVVNVVGSNGMHGAAMSQAPSLGERDLRAAAPK